MSKTKQAVWITEYDYITDKLYKCPGCPDCEEQIGRFRNVYKCYNCGTVVNVDDKAMKEWFKLREETKTEYGDCVVIKVNDDLSFGCGGKNCVKKHFRRNPVTLEWQMSGAKCEKCGNTIIV